VTFNSTGDTKEANATVTGPLAGAVLASIPNVPPGYYKADVTYSTSGTTTAADSDNVGLNVPGDPQYVVPDTQGTPAESSLFQTWFVTVLGVADTVTLTAIANGGAAAVYHVTLKLTLWPNEANDRL